MIRLVVGRHRFRDSVSMLHRGGVWAILNDTYYAYRTQYLLVCLNLFHTTCNSEKLVFTQYQHCFVKGENSESVSYVKNINMIYIRVKHVTYLCTMVLVD